MAPRRHGRPDFHDDLASPPPPCTARPRRSATCATLGELRAGDEDEFYGGIVVGAPRALVAADLCGGLGAPKRFEAHSPHHRAFQKGRASRLLAGGVVGGPARAGVVYEDRRQDHVTSEVALGYSAPAVLLAASL